MESSFCFHFKELRIDGGFFLNLLAQISHTSSSLNQSRSCFASYEGVQSYSTRIQISEVIIAFFGQHSIHYIVTNALVDEHIAQTLLHELSDLGYQLASLFRSDIQQIEAASDNLVQGNMVVSVQQNIDNAQSLTTQRIGVLGAGGSQATAKGCANIIQLVGNAYNATNVGLGQLVTGKAGQIMLINAQSHLRSFAIQLRIFAAHNALQLSEFYNHTGNQIAFAQESSALELRLINLSIDSHG